MKILIDIPEITYKELKLLTKQGFGTIIDKAVANGKPLEFITGFLNDIHSLRDNYNKLSPYFPEDLESDFFKIMEKWERKGMKNEYHN